MALKHRNIWLSRAGMVAPKNRTGGSKVAGGISYNRVNPICTLRVNGIFVRKHNLDICMDSWYNLKYIFDWYSQGKEP